MTKTPAISTRWFPTCAFSASTGAFADAIYSDFDQQSEQLSGHDQSYLQLSTGTFRGRFLSGFLSPDLSIHMEYINQAMEQEAAGAPDHFSFGIALEAGAALRVNGRDFGPSDMFLLSPGASLHALCPTDTVWLVVTMRRATLLDQPALAPEVADWLSDLQGQPAFLLLPGLAARLREDALSALESASRMPDTTGRAALAQALAASLAAKLSLQWGHGQSPPPEDIPDRAYTRFQEWRDLLRHMPEALDDTTHLTALMLPSKRSVETAFSRTVAMGPLTYLRLLRLHAARRDLADPRHDHLTIGDIAARHGFWDWSRFSAQCRRQFGRTPSQIRQRRP